MSRAARILAPLLLALVCLATFASAEASSPIAAAAGAVSPVGPRPGHLTAEDPFGLVGEARVTAAGQATVRVSMWMFKDDHYIYDARTTFKVTAPDGVTVGEVKRPKPEIKHDPNFDEDMAIHHGTPTFEIPLSFTAAQAFPVKVSVRYQGCNPTQCFLFKTVELDLTVDPAKLQAALPATDAAPPAEVAQAPDPAPVVPAVAAPVSPKAAPVSSASAATSSEVGWKDLGDVNKLVGASLWLAFLGAFGAGLLTSLTPCVYPVIPITLRVLGATQSGSRVQAFSLAFVYVLGMAGVYTALGVAAAATGGLFGAWLQNPFVVGTLVVIFIAMGFSMLGAFDIAVPSSIATRLADVQGHGYTGAFLAGTVSGVVVGPCSAPVLLSLLGFIANTGRLGLGSALMFTYAMGLGVLFLVLGTFAASLPRSGAWMESVKGILALLIFGVAVWYMRLLVGALYSEGTYAVIVGAFAVTAGTFMGAFHPLTWEEDWTRKSRKALGILAVVGGLFFVVDGLLISRGVDSGLAALGSGGGGAAADARTIPWVTDEGAGLAQAQQLGRPAIVDFTADWCAVCQEIEHDVYGDPRVVDSLQGFVPILIDGTHDDDPQFVALKAKYQVSALPRIVFIDAEGKVREDLSVTGLVTADEFLRRLSVTRDGGHTALR